MKNKVVIFGAGAIGRGLLGDIAVTNGYEAVFVEAVAELADKLAKRGSYQVNLVGQLEQSHNISDYKALGINDNVSIFKQLAECGFAATAVGGANLEPVAGLIAAGLAKRQSVLNILVCENWPKADIVLTESLISRDADKDSFRCVPCSVERMAKNSKDGLDVIVESGQSLYVDTAKWVGVKPKIDELLFCENIEAYYKRKLYTNNAGHVLLAYMGRLAGCEFLYEALAKSQIRQFLEELLNASAEILVRRYGFSRTDMQRHIDELVKWRFSNPKLADTVTRVARDPLRKLSSQERLVSLACLLEQNNLPTKPVCRVIAAAMYYFDSDDRESVRMAELIAENGPQAVLRQICGFDENSPCFKECLEFFYKK